MRRQESADENANLASDALLTKRELAPKLKRSRRTIDVWMRQGKLPYFKLGKTVLFRWPDVLEKLNAYRVN
jgi:excisionase family DNA binding protein